MQVRWEQNLSRRGRGHPKVAELDGLEVRRDEQVGRLHVAVHHRRRPSVQVLESPEHLRRVAQGARQWRSPHRGEGAGGGGGGAGGGVDVGDGACLHELEDLRVQDSRAFGFFTIIEYIECK